MSGCAAALPDPDFGVRCSGEHNTTTILSTALHRVHGHCGTVVLWQCYTSPVRDPRPVFTDNCAEAFAYVQLKALPYTWLPTPRSWTHLHQLCNEVSSRLLARDGHGYTPTRCSQILGRSIAFLPTSKATATATSLLPNWAQDPTPFSPHLTLHCSTSPQPCFTSLTCYTDTKRHQKTTMPFKLSHLSSGSASCAPRRLCSRSV